MSSHGPPGDPYGEPADPRHAPPTDPWGDRPLVTGPVGSPAYPTSPSHPLPSQEPRYDDAAYGSPSGYLQPAGGPGQPAGYGQPVGYGQPPPAHDVGPGAPAVGPGFGPQVTEPSPEKGRQGVLLIVIVVLALLIGVGGFTAFLLSDRNKKDDVVTPPTPTANATPTFAEGDFRSTRESQCVTVTGPADDPIVAIVACDQKTELPKFEVLKRFNGTTDRDRCVGVKDYTHHYFYNYTVDSLDFVLCMKVAK